MLEVLFGNKNVIRILLFLFVNKRCYATQIKRTLRTPLTPLQHAFKKLEDTGLITSTFEGKTKIYHFHSTFPLLHEMEQLLKKYYTLLSSEEKKKYYLVSHETERNLEGSRHKIVNTFWEKLACIQSLQFFTSSKEAGGWNRRGSGDVTVTKMTSTTILFTERGKWEHQNDSELNFTNIFRWTLDRNLGLISLEHLRHGNEHPVFIFHLAPTKKNILSAVNSHLCSEDTYFGHVKFDAQGFELTWRVIGPKKNEHLHYLYGIR